jgi:three-Cys-motif partner protein
MRRIKSHSLQKLQYFKKYVDAYLLATKKMPRKYFIDAFAGTGKCILCGAKCKGRGGSRCVKCGNGKVIDGSALIVAKTKNVFSGYIFIEIGKKNIDLLKRFIGEEVSEDRKGRISIEKNDANKLSEIIHEHIPGQAGCLIFLDPEGPELFWETLTNLSKIKKVELLILYPYDMSLVRLTTGYKEKLNRFYGSEKWTEQYEAGRNAEERKEILLNYYLNNLKSLGFEYVVCKQVRRKIREGKALYHLILASHHPVGEKIMRQIFDKELDGQIKMKLKF